MENRPVLVVEDDTDINHLLKRILERSGYRVVQAYSGTEALLRLQMDLPVMILLDLMLPGLCGEELIPEIRKRSDVPILVLSAKTALENKIETLRLGADDYLTKPFEPEEVAARVSAALRRYLAVPAASVSEEKDCIYKQLRLRPDAREALVNGQVLQLTAHEYDILCLLLKNPSKVFSRENLYTSVWGSDYYGEDNTVNMHISNLRKKLALLDPDEEYIKTVWGIGFKLA